MDTDEFAELKPLIISAPFGNYIQPVGTTPTLGTFTAQPRGGRLWRIIRTVWWYPRMGAWINKIGLRNPGIAWLEQRVECGRVSLGDKLLSIHGFNEAEWFDLLDRAGAMKPLGIELNMSCPNVGEVDWPTELFPRAASLPVPVIVKLPPVNYGDMADRAVDAGLTALHCCNTLPVPVGGVSGRPLKPVSLQCIADLRSRSYGDQLTIIGGGGIYRSEDVDDYRRVGADRFAVGTKVMNPWYLFSHAGLAGIVERAGSKGDPNHA